MVEPSLLAAAGWSVAAFSASIVFGVVYWRGGSLREAAIASLILLKAVALGLWALGLDRPLLTIYVYRGGTVHTITITANLLLALSLLATNLLLLAWPRLSQSISGRREELPGVPPRPQRPQREAVGAA